MEGEEVTTDLDKDVVDVARDAVEVWPEEGQMRMAQEECGELVAAINRYRRGRCTVEDLSSEVADVLITVTQMRLLLGPVVDAQIAAKVKRLRDRIEETRCRT